MEKEKNIILTEDHVIVRNGLKVLIEKLGPYRISGEYNNGQELVAAYPFSPTPDLIILDLDMPQMDGAAVVKWMHQQKVSIPVLLLTLNDNEEQIVKLFHLGVRGYLHKNCSSDTMKKAISEILHTGYYHDELFSKAMLGWQPATPHSKPEEHLTERELQFLKLVCHEDEYTYNQIADIMEVGRRTVDNFREAIFDKFGIKSKTGLVLFAIKQGIIKI
jgi:DNA-binding NarL/FixJ family response regulator